MEPSEYILPYFYSFPLILFSPQRSPEFSPPFFKTDPKLHLRGPLYTDNSVVHLRIKENGVVFHHWSSLTTFYNDDNRNIIVLHSVLNDQSI